jgi:Holliday junction resolvase
MAMTPEAKVKHQVKKALDALGVYHFSPQSGIYGRSGIPDIIGCYKGHFIAVECKAGKGTTTALQDKELKCIRDAGGIALVINETNITEVTKCLIDF